MCSLPRLVQLIRLFHICCILLFLSLRFRLFVLLFFLNLLVLLILLSIVITFIVNKILSRTLCRDDKVSFVLELSDYRRIKLGKLIVRRIFDRALFVLGRAVVASVIAGVVIYLVTNIMIDGITILEFLSNFFSSLGRLMGLDGVILFTL